MKASQIIALHEFKVMFRRRVFLIVTLGLPVAAMIVLLVVALIQSQKDEPGEQQVGLVDSTSLFTESLTQGLVEFVPYDNVDPAMEALLAKEIKRLYVVSPDYLKTG